MGIGPVGTLILRLSLRGLVAFGASAMAMATPMAIAMAAEGASPLADIGPAPAVSLTDATGKPFDLARLRGKAVLLSFVYTTCGGTCPATTASCSPSLKFRPPLATAYFLPVAYSTSLKSCSTVPTMRQP